LIYCLDNKLYNDQILTKYKTLYHQNSAEPAKIMFKVNSRTDTRNKKAVLRELLQVGTDRK